MISNTAMSCDLFWQQQTQRRPVTDTHRASRAHARTNSGIRSNCFARTGGAGVRVLGRAIMGLFDLFSGDDTSKTESLSNKPAMRARPALLRETKAAARADAEALGVEGIHSHRKDGIPPREGKAGELYMAGESHSALPDDPSAVEPASDGVGVSDGMGLGTGLDMGTNPTDSDLALFGDSDGDSEMEIY